MNLFTITAEIGRLAFPSQSGLVNSDNLRKEVQPISTPESSKPIPGEFRVARFEGAMPRLMLVIAAPGEDVSLVTLVSDEVDNATHRDVLVQPEESGLSYPVIVETDLCVPVWNSQLDGPAGKLTDRFSFLLRPQPDLDEVVPALVGSSIESWFLDPRWDWKENELSEANSLSGACYAKLVDC